MAHGVSHRCWKTYMPLFADPRDCSIGTCLRLWPRGSSHFSVARTMLRWQTYLVSLRKHARMVRRFSRKTYEICDMNSALLASPYSSSLYSNRPNPTDVFIRRGRAHIVFSIIPLSYFSIGFFSSTPPHWSSSPPHPSFGAAIVGISKLVFGFWDSAMFQ